MSIIEDRGLMETLRALCISPKGLIDIGGEAAVFRHGPEHIARIGHEWVTQEYAGRRISLLKDLAASPYSFSIPTVIETLCPHGRVVTIERYLPGETLQSALRNAQGTRREKIIVAALDASLEFAGIDFRRDTYRDLYWDPPTEHESWRGFLAARARRSLTMAGPTFAQVNAEALAAPFELAPPRGFVHFDLYPGNLLVDGERVSAVLDFSGMSLCGDPRFDPISLVTYLDAEVTGGREPTDRAVCTSWLKGHDLLQWLKPAEKLIAAIWSFAQDDQVVADWTKRVLLSKK